MKFPLVTPLRFLICGKSATGGRGSAGAAWRSGSSWKSRALCPVKARVLILDEPTALLPPAGCAGFSRYRVIFSSGTNASSALGRFIGYIAKLVVGPRLFQYNSYLRTGRNPK